MLYFSTPFSTYVHPTSVQVRTRFLNKRQLFVKIFFLVPFYHWVHLSCLSVLYTRHASFLSSTLSHAFNYLPHFYSLSLCDVGYGIADFQTAPVDSSRHGEQSQQHHQHPRDVNALGVPSRLPRAHLNKPDKQNVTLNEEFFPILHIIR